ncbi:hypothetical protein ACFST9_14540 [Hymenobacter monticola]|uniref:Uncharacterized protein n=1 Tax=Hymenobacter monticola TaxID=1705399 RepID=A0ABY4BJ78_9BACT|nr:hypothetical protein [Hymenobacter monticola]UOE36670.1 hypothetical protein MTP16_25160 [Hymenobacter monticola]
MTFSQFDALPYERQLVAIFATATLLARRLEQATCLYLYHLPGGFFAELYYNKDVKEIALFRTFTTSAPLVDYVAGVKLPEIANLLD